MSTSVVTTANRISIAPDDVRRHVRRACLCRRARRADRVQHRRDALAGAAGERDDLFALVTGRALRGGQPWPRCAGPPPPVPRRGRRVRPPERLRDQVVLAVARPLARPRSAYPVRLLRRARRSTGRRSAGTPKTAARLGVGEHRARPALTGRPSEAQFDANVVRVVGRPAGTTRRPLLRATVVQVLTYKDRGGRVRCGGRVPSPVRRANERASTRRGRRTSPARHRGPARTRTTRRTS